jgi:hypothetical protein
MILTLIVLLLCIGVLDLLVYYRRFQNLFTAAKNRSVISDKPLLVIGDHSILPRHICGDICLDSFGALTCGKSSCVKSSPDLSTALDTFPDSSCIVLIINVMAYATTDHAKFDLLANELDRITGRGNVFVFESDPKKEPVSWILNSAIKYIFFHQTYKRRLVATEPTPSWTKFESIDRKSFTQTLQYLRNPSNTQ